MRMSERMVEKDENYAGAKFLTSGNLRSPQTLALMSTTTRSREAGSGDDSLVR